MQYLLMNKDKITATAALSKGMGETINIIKVTGSMPLGLSSFTAWIENRRASKHNHHLNRLMTECGCDTLSGFIDVTHAASVNDTFWIKRENDETSWSDVSLYRNDFNETISKFAFYGLGIPDINLSSTSPELVMDGSYPKCVKKEKSGIFLYKRGYNNSYNGGLEPYGEVIAGEIFNRICSSAVKYELVQLHGIITSRCKLFTDEKYGYVPMSSIAPTGMAVDELYSYMSKFSDDSAERFREMIVCDAITFNQDRHFGNFGVLIDNDTVTPLKMAPLFDYNQAMLPYVLDEEFENIGDKLLDYSLKSGDDFTRLGQQAVTDSIADKLKDLKGFEFDLKCDDKFTESRLKKINELVNRQIEAVLSNEILYTKDVFIPYKQIEHQKVIQKANDLLNSYYPYLKEAAEKSGLF